MDIKMLAQSKIFRTSIIVTGVLLVAFMSFASGVAVGLRKARFSYAFGENYERNFSVGPFGPGRGRMMDGDDRASAMSFSGPGKRDFRNGHGISGDIISVAEQSLIVKDALGNENTVLADDDLLVKSGPNNVKFSDLNIGDKIIIIGKPNDDGVVHAEFIRVFFGQQGQ